MNNSIKLENLSKYYPAAQVQALDNISFEVKAGELFGLIGPDGAGKTTLFRILTTLLLADSGQASVAGFDVVKDFWDIRKSVGYMPGRFSLYQDLSIQENLDFFATIFNTTVAENYHLIEDIYTQLAPFKDRPAGKLSGGMKQKLALCCALVHEPKVLFLDEPTTGVDPVSRKDFWDMLDRLKAKGISILVSTPYMDEAKRCDRIALIQKGKLLEVDTLANIAKKHPMNLYAVKSDNMYQLLLDLRDYPHTHSCFAFGEYHHLSLADGYTNTEHLQAYLAFKGHQNIDTQAIQADIEDTFISLSQSTH